MKLNAPRGYHWTDAAVRYEKRDSLLTGLLLGLPIGAVLVLIIVWFAP